MHCNNTNIITVLIFLLVQSSALICSKEHSHCNQQLWFMPYRIINLSKVTVFYWSTISSQKPQFMERTSVVLYPVILIRQCCVFKIKHRLLKDAW